MPGEVRRDLLDRRYYINADSNTISSPGSPRALRVAIADAVPIVSL